MNKKIKAILIGLITNLPFILSLLGVASIVYASFLFNLIVGFLVLGVALILVAYIISPQDTAKGR